MCVYGFLYRVRVANAMAQESWNCDTAEGSGCQPQEGLVMCINNCGVLGCAATMNLCSQCFIEKMEGSPAYVGNASEKVAAAMVASTEKSLISASLAEKSMIPPTFSSVASAAGSEKAFANCTFSLSSCGTADNPAPLSPLAVGTSAEEAKKTPSLSISSRSLAHSALGPELSADLTPIVALFSSDVAYVQPAARRQSANKCLTCKKRMGFLGFKCRCGNMFCASHRYSDKHACPFDYKAAGREAIAKANPIVKAPKVERI